MKFREYIDYWKEVVDKKYDYKDSIPVLYLKDWHLFQEDDTNCELYDVPEYFESDYLNEYCLTNGLTDYRFVYMGPKYSL